MLLFSVLVSAGLASLSFSLPTDLQATITSPTHTSSTIRDVLLGAEIIGDVLDDFEPAYFIDLAYPKGHEAVLLGNDIPVKAVSKRPTFTFHSLAPTSTKKNSTFTLVLTDPDATSRADPAKSEMCHWILTNLTTPLPEDGMSTVFEPDLPFLGILKSKKEGELKSYYPPAPPPKTGKHRYVFVLLEGDSTDIQAPGKRPHWGYGKVRHGVKDWAEENDLKVVGANFFYAANKKQ
jgi:phosphatidylethanolamine-binding protein